MEKYLEINLPSAVMDQLPIFSSTTLVNNLDLCEFNKENKINRFFFFPSYCISYPQRPDFSLNYFQPVKSAALLSIFCARKQCFIVNAVFQDILRIVLLVY